MARLRADWVAVVVAGITGADWVAVYTGVLMFDFNAPRGYERINGTAYFYGRTQRMEMLKTILSNSAVWGALVALVNGIIAAYFPQIPAQIVLLVNGLVAAILAAVGISQGRIAAAYTRGYEAAKNE